MEVGRDPSPQQDANYTEEQLAEIAGCSVAEWRRRVVAAEEKEAIERANRAPITLTPSPPGWTGPVIEIVSRRR